MPSRKVATRNSDAIKISRSALKTIQPGAKPITHWDSELPGFGLHVRPSGARSYLVQYRANGGGRGSPLRRMVLGPADESLTPEQARALARDVLAEVRRGGDPAASRQEARKADTVRELADAWMKHVEATKKPATVKFYDGLVRLYVVPALGGKKAVTVTRADVAKLHADVGIKRKVAPRPGQQRAPKERAMGGKGIANRMLKTLSSMFGWSERMGLLPEGHPSPTRKVELFAENARRRFLSPEEMQRLGDTLRLAETEGLPWEPDASKPAECRRHVPRTENRREVIAPAVCNAVRLLLLTGCRLREVLNLTWGEVDWSRSVLALKDSKTGSRIVFLSEAALVVLRQLHEDRMGSFVVPSTSAGSDGEKPRADINRPWRAICKAARLEGVHVHDLRHSYASTGAAGGLGLPVIGALLGHRDLKSTQRYSHISAPVEKRAADMIGAEIAAVMGLASAEVLSLVERRRRA